MIELWKHQQRAIERAREQSNLALFMGMGTGKTASLIHILREDFNKHKRMSRTLIFCPLSVCTQWKDEILKFSKIPAEKIHVLTGAGKKRAEQMASIDAGIVITNYEAVLIQAFYAELLRWNPEILVCDESHRLKDGTSKRNKQIYPLAKAADRRFLLTGTPVLQSMMDLFGQFKIMDDSIFGRNFFVFRSTYFYDRNAHLPRHVHFPDWRPKPSAEEELGRLVGHHSVQAKKEECLDLPDLLKVTVPVEMSPEQEKAYRAMEKEFVAEMSGAVVFAEFAMIKVLKLLQIQAGFIQPEDSEPVWVKDNPRLKALEELLESLGKEKVIIWTVFRPTYKKISAVCEKLGLKYGLFTGEQSAAEKDIALKGFQHGDTQVLISNAASGGVGLNISVAKYAIYYSKTHNLEHFLQSEARNHRGGSEIHDKIVHYHLTVRNTLDDVVNAALLQKKKVGDAVLEWAKK